jgi:polar amino acid transport system permease protein
MLTRSQFETLLDGAWVTVQLTVASALVGVAISFVVGVARLARSTWVRAIARVYTEIFRGIAALILLFWIFYTLPTFGGPRLTAFVAGVIALGLNMGAYGSEIVRGAVMAVPKGQSEAAISVNLTSWQRLRLVVLPQAFVAMLPPFGNLLIEVLKGTALVSLITLSDLTFQAQVLRSSTGRTLAVFSLTLLLYFLMALVITGAVRLLERRVSRGLDIGRGAGSLAEPI